MLVVLALERQPVSRDTLVDMFWGEQEEERARHSLSDALSHLRRVLGRDAITIGSSEVSLASQAVAVDANDLADAVERRDPARALALYMGPFLDAVYVDSSPRFEHWAQRERDRIQRLFARACRDQCAILAREARWTECAAVAERWLEQEPLSSEGGVTLLRALAAPRSRDADASVVSAFNRLRSRLEKEMEMSPAPEVVALARDAEGRLAASARASAEAQATTTLPARGDDAPEAAPTPAVMVPRRRPAVSPRTATLLAIGVTAALALTLPRLRTSDPPASPTLVAVLPFDVTGGGSDVRELGTGMMDLLSTSLDGAGSLRAVDPRALLSQLQAADTASPIGLSTARRIVRRFGAGLFVMGRVVEAGERISLSAALYDRARGEAPVATGTVEGAPSELFALVDEMTRQLLTGYPEQSPDRLTGLAALTTASLPALKAYLAGVTEYRAARYDAAFSSFERAASLDSTFALAHYQLSNAALWSAHGGWDSVLNSAHRAARHDGRLARRHRLLVQAYLAFRAGNLDRAEQLYRYLVTNYPDDVEAAYQLGDVLYHGNPPRGRSFVESRVPFERVLSVEPQHRGALLHLLRLAMYERRHADVKQLVGQALRLSQPPDQAELRALLAYALDDSAAQSHAVDALARAPDEVVRVTAMRIALYDGDLAGAERVSRLLLDDARAPEFRVVGHLHLADLALAGGRRRDALAHLDSVSGMVPEIGLEYRALHLLMPFLTVPRDELVSVRSALQQWNGDAPLTEFPMWRVYNGLHGHIRLYLLALVSARLGELEAAVTYANQLANAQAQPGAMAWEARAFADGLSESVRGHVAAALGDTAGALTHFERGRLKVSEGLLDAPFGSQPLERFARAELLLGRGALDEAHRWYSSIPETTMDKAVFLAPILRRTGEIAERIGNRRESAAAIGRARELWWHSER